MAMTKDEFGKIMETVFAECVDLRRAGQKEYAAGSDSPFANFERIASECDIPRELVLYIYLKKHMDGIRAWINGHRSQREDVRGRINDAIVYLNLLRGMVEDEPQFNEVTP